jgi:hypothetical protein
MSLTELFLARNNFSSFLAYYFLKLHSHHFSKTTSHKEVAKPLGIKVFLTIFACLLMNSDPDPGGPNTYESCGYGSATLVGILLRNAARKKRPQETS